MSAAPSYPWHERLWQRLDAARRAQRLPHAILLAGPPGLGKAAFARRTAHALVCARPAAEGDACGACAACHLSRAGSHPDLGWVAPEEPGKAIRIDAVRDLAARSTLAAGDGGYRVFVIDPADAMNRAAANALLKTLEEPVAHTVLILVSSHPDRLMPTIRSRCQVLRFAPPPTAAVRRWLAAHAQGEDVEGLLAVCGGAPLRALQARDEGWLDASRRVVGELAALKNRQRNPIQIIEEWEKRPLTLVVDCLKRCLADLVRLANGLGEHTLLHPGLRADLQSLGQNIDLQALFAFNDALAQIERDAAHNLNPSMVLEHTVNTWLQITRPGGQ